MICKQVYLMSRARLLVLSGNGNAAGQITFKTEMHIKCRMKKA
jgi:hypothetical protein